MTETPLIWLLPCLKWALSILRNCKVLLKTKNYVWNQNCLIWVFQGRIWKKLFHVWNQHPWILQNAKLHVNKKDFHFETKVAWLGYFWDAILKNYYHNLNQHPQFVELQSFIQTIKLYTCDEKCFISGLPDQNLKKSYCQIWNQRLRICQNAKFRVKEKKLGN